MNSPASDAEPEIRSQSSESKQESDQQVEVTRPASSACEQDSTAASDIIGNRRRSSGEKGMQDKWMIILTMALVLVGFLQVGAMFRQTTYMGNALRATEDATRAAQVSAEAAMASIKQNQVALETARLDQRAWLLVKHVTTPVFEIGKPLDVILTLQNKGNTPAIEVCLSLTNEALTAGILPAFAQIKPSKEASRGIVGPDVDIWVSHSLTPLADGRVGVLGGPDFVAIVSGEKRICIHGRAEYRDVFGRSQWLKFCYIMRVVKDERTVSGYDAVWTVFPAANDLSSN